MHKVIAYTALLYGKAYLEYAIKSVIDHVDEYHVLYALNPSHGHSGAPSPETEIELLEIAAKAAGNKLHWHEGRWTQEGQQRDTILELAGNADAIINLDSDEIWSVNLPHAIEQLARENVRRVRIPMIHYYRSFYNGIPYDPAYPERITFPKVKDNSETTYRPVLDTGGNLTYVMPHINHFGYCQSADLIRYKLSIHGHKNELRMSAEDYVNQIYLDEKRVTDLHPVGSEFWNITRVNPMDWLPEFMQDHPYYGLEFVK